jgi:catechol 2,3-dioxygenase-like lactoylglutathione lyase family enzyme
MRGIPAFFHTAPTSRGLQHAAGTHRRPLGRHPFLYHDVFMTIARIQLFSLPVSDQDRSRNFYVDSLGFELIEDAQMGPDMRWVQVAPPGSATSITLVTWFPTMPAGSTKGTVMETDDLDGDVAALRRKGVRIDGDIQEMPWGRFVTFDDPDGNGIVLQSTASRG